MTLTGFGRNPQKVKPESKIYGCPPSGLVAVADSTSMVDLLDATDPARLRLVGSGKSPLCWWWPDLEHADGNSSDGLWVPLGTYGVMHVPVQP